MSEGEDQIEAGMTAGERLRVAREGLGLSIDDVATSTRIPTRHLASLETGDFSKLPAPTYSIGFAKSYAGAVGLNRNEIGEQLRAELGGSTRVHANQADQFEPLDPARAMPKWLILVAIAAIAVVVIAATWLSNRAQNAPDNVTSEEASADPGLTVPPPAPAAAPAATGPVLITATQQAWIQVKDGTTLLKEGVLEPGQSFAVPPSATAPVLTTAKAEGLRITVGDSRGTRRSDRRPRASARSACSDRRCSRDRQAHRRPGPGCTLRLLRRRPPVRKPVRPLARPHRRPQPHRPPPTASSRPRPPNDPPGCHSGFRKPARKSVATANPQQELICACLRSPLRLFASPC